MEHEFIKHIKATREDLKDGVSTFEYNGVDYCVDKFETYSADTKGATNILDAVLIKIPINDKLYKNIISSCINKIFFKNGYYDFIKSEFIYNFDNVDTLTIIQRDYKEASSEQQLYVKKILFESVFNDDVDEFLLMIARAISGNVADKLWSVIFGGRDAGKGIIQRSLGECFEKYVCTINANSLISNSKGGDESKKLSWMYNFDKHRLAFSNEMRIEPGVEADGELIKMICGGGDKVQLRKNNVDEKEIIPQAMLILCANDIAKFKPNDVYEKLIPFSLKTKFVNEEITPKLLKANPFYKKADKNIHELIKTSDIIDAVTTLIIKSYKLEQVKPNEEMSIILETFKDENDINKILFENFEITGNPKHAVFNDVMKSFIKEKNLSVSFPKIVNILNTKGIKYTDKRVEGTDLKKRAFIGLVKIIKNDDSFIDN